MENTQKTGRYLWRSAEQIAERAELVEYLRQLSRDGYSTKEIAAKLCVSESTIRSVFKIIHGQPNV